MSADSVDRGLRPAAVLVSGLYGAGKTSVVEEIADRLELAGIGYAALDLDWLWWFDVPGLRETEARGVLLDNLGSMVDTYRAAGVDRFVMAWSLRNGDDVQTLRSSLEMDLRVVELVVPLSVIEARLGSAATTGRLTDLAEARRWAAEGLGVGLGDLEIDGDRPIADVATEILEWLGWVG